MRLGHTVVDSPAWFAAYAANCRSASRPARELRTGHLLHQLARPCRCPARALSSNKTVTIINRSIPARQKPESCRPERRLRAAADSPDRHERSRRAADLVPVAGRLVLGADRAMVAADQPGS